MAECQGASKYLPSLMSTSSQKIVLYAMQVTAVMLSTLLLFKWIQLGQQTHFLIEILPSWPIPHACALYPTRMRYSQCGSCEKVMCVCLVNLASVGLSSQRAWLEDCWANHLRWQGIGPVNGYSRIKLLQMCKSDPCAPGFPPA